MHPPVKRNILKGNNQMLVSQEGHLSQKSGHNVNINIGKDKPEPLMGTKQRLKGHHSKE